MRILDAIRWKDIITINKMQKLFSTFPGINLNPPYTHTIHIQGYGLVYTHTPLSSREVLTRSLFRTRVHTFKGYLATRFIFVVYFNVCRFYLSLLLSRIIGTISDFFKSYVCRSKKTHRVSYKKILRRSYSTSSRNSGKKLFANYYLLCPDREIVLCKDSINQLVENFWRDVFQHAEDTHVLLQLRIKSTDAYYSLSKIQTVTIKDKARLLEVLTESLDLLYERYTQFPIQELFFRYSILSTNSPVARTSLQSNVLKVDHLDTLSHLNLPATIDLSKWGKTTKLNDLLTLVNSGNRTFTVQSSGNTRTVNVLLTSREEVLTSFRDEIVDIQSDEFIRIMDSGKVISYKEGKQIKSSHTKKDTVYIPIAPKAKRATFEVITLDLETQRLPDDSLRVISRSARAVFFDGKEFSSYFINDFADSNTMLSQMIIDLFTSRNHNKTVYIHNLSGFDGMFLLKALAQFADGFKIIRKDDKIIQLTVTRLSTKAADCSIVKRGMDKVTLVFKDSLLLLPSSLKKLGCAFEVQLKGDFAHTISDSCSSREQFEAIREELLEYNTQDCLVLYSVLQKFSELIFKMFRVDISQTPTISSLAMLIYRSNYLPRDARIGIRDVKLFDKVKSAYTGGAVDVFTPLTDPNSQVFCYDVNSLYPAVMQNLDYPVGPPTFIEGSVDLSAPQTFGFCKVRVTAPTDLHVPLLQCKLDGRTVAPLGTWTGWYFTEELRLAQTLGYEFEVIEAILYERGQIFKQYVSKLYEMRTSFATADPRNLICKLLLNSLYGKFGMSPRLTSWELMEADTELFNNMKSGILPTDIIELGSKVLIGKDLIRNKVVSNTLPGSDTVEHRSFLNISLPIAAAVTAYARCNIYQYKKYAEWKGALYYSDTDSIFCSEPLPNYMISSKLGAMKLEFQAKRAVFLAPKVYAVHFQDGSTKFKIKGSKNNFGLKFSDLEALLHKESSLPIAQEKWYRSFTQSTININKTLYTLRVTENKRALMYTNDKFVYTRPFVITDGKVDTI